MQQLMRYAVLPLMLAIAIAAAPTRSWVADWQVVQTDVYVQPYVRSDGTTVQGHMRSAPDGNPYNNYSFPGNTNPYTGRVAPGNPDTYLRNYYNGAGGGTYNPYGGRRNQ